MTIDLPDDVASMLNTLYEAGVFEIKNGSATLHFDASGTLYEIDGDIKLYRKGKPIIRQVGVVFVESEKIGGEKNDIYGIK